MKINEESEICDISGEFTISQSVGEEFYRGMREMFLDAISQSQKEKGDEWIRIAKVDGTIGIMFYGS